MPTGSFIWGCFEATSKLKLVIVTLFVQQQLQPQQASPPPSPPHGETCDILQTALPFATSNKINLIPSVVQIVFSNL